MQLQRVLHTVQHFGASQTGARISFSQYAEDMLLAHMNPQARGFYVDVGACHPRNGSNTYKLYRRGWSGITIEPNPDMVKTFRQLRPRDTHLPVGVSVNGGDLTYYRSEQANYNSFDPNWQRKFGVAVIESVPVKCFTLAEIFDKHCPHEQVDLLSVDCEGFDMEVLESSDWARFRPTVVIVEDMKQFSSGTERCPSSPIRTFMLDRDYGLASQAIFSSFYVDRHALNVADRRTGFRLDRSQLSALAFR